MKALPLLVTLIFLLAPAFLVAQTCADTGNIYHFSYHGKKYEIVKEKKSWDSAAACAVWRGGYLAQINNQAEQDSIYFAITHGASIPSIYTTVADGGGIAYIWIGATDKHTEGTWLWDGNNDNIGNNFWNGQGAAGAGTGGAVGGAYNHWGGTSSGGANEPDNYAGTQNAAAIGLSAWPYGVAGEWNDINASNNLYYIIEYDSSSVVQNINTVGDERITLYPNPARNLINIIFTNSGEYIHSATLYNQAGEIVLIETYNNATNITFKTADLAAGFYYISIECSNGVRVNKPVIVY